MGHPVLSPSLILGVILNQIPNILYLFVKFSVCVSERVVLKQHLSHLTLKQ